jgi:hypothetical protein
MYSFENQGKEMNLQTKTLVPGLRLNVRVVDDFTQVIPQ